MPPPAPEPYEQWRKRMASGGRGLFLKEYNSVGSDVPEAKCRAFKDNPEENRWENVKLWDETRVVLNDGLEGDYIHASRVGGYHYKPRMILTQAPLFRTRKDYWRMVWQEKVQVCVTLTALAEDDVEKSAKFYPISMDEPIRAGPFRVLMDEMTDFSPRKFVLVRCKLLCWLIPPDQPDRERTVFVIVYGDWPDRGVPENPAAFLEFLDIIRNVSLNSWSVFYKEIDDKEHSMAENPPPIVINCNAGVGRSATMAACIREVRRLREDKQVDLLGTLHKIRKERAGAIQNALQYMFVAQVLVEAWQQMKDNEEEKAEKEKTENAPQQSAVAQ